MSKALLTFILALSLCQVSRADTRIVTETLDLHFAYDGSVTSAIACFPSHASENARCGQFAGNGVIGFEGGGGSWKELPNHSDTHFELRFEGLSGASITWKIPLQGYALELYTKGLDGLSLDSGALFRPREAAGFGGWLEQTRYLGISGRDVVQLGLDEDEENSLAADDWLGYRNRFWALLVSQGSERGNALSAQIRTGETNLDANMRLALDASPETGFSIYMGPVEPRVLRAADARLGNVLYAGLWFWLRWICFALFYLLSWIGMVIPSWGLSVMVMSLIVHVLMLPLSRIAERLQQQVHATEARLAPELQRIKKEFKGEVQSAKILALYKTERVHPLYSLKSMMGVAVVVPIFIGAFDMLAENIHLMNASFLWIADLSRPDAIAVLPFSLPFFGAELNLLPFLMTGLSVAASAMHNPPALNAELRKKQVRNMLLMALGFFALFYTFPAGMVLYWTTNNLISVSKSLWARRYNSKHPKKGEKA
jgi:YidC/Oxa1 family membrane protein insertase